MEEVMGAPGLLHLSAQHVLTYTPPLNTLGSIGVSTPVTLRARTRTSVGQSWGTYITESMSWFFVIIRNSF